MWSRWKAAQSLHEMGRALGKDHVLFDFRGPFRGPVTISLKSGAFGGLNVQ